MIELIMKTGMGGPDFSLAPRDRHEFDDDEAIRLVDAEYAEPVDQAAYDAMVEAKAKVESEAAEAAEKAEAEKVAAEAAAKAEAEKVAAEKAAADAAAKANAEKQPSNEDANVKAPAAAAPAKKRAPAKKA